VIHTIMAAQSTGTSSRVASKTGVGMFILLIADVGPLLLGAILGALIA
jgi:hypothetical protein